jgi:hypothetical protein
MKCFLLCDSCKEKILYKKGVKNICSFCEKEVEIEEGVQDLVIVLNNIGIVTTSSCEGHKDGFDRNKRTYPCVVFLKDYEKLTEIIKNYNEKTGDEFVIRHQRTIHGWKNFLFHKEISRNLEENHKSVLLLAKYINTL